MDEDGSLNIEDVRSLIFKAITSPGTSEHTEVFLLMHSYFIDHYDLVNELIALASSVVEQREDKKNKKDKDKKKRAPTEVEVKMKVKRISNVILRLFKINSWRFICEPDFLDYVTNKIETGKENEDPMIKKMFVDLNTRLGEEVDRVHGKFTSDRDLLVEFAPKDHVSKYDKLSSVGVNDLAEQITLISHTLYSYIPSDELLHRNYHQASTSRFLWTYKKWIQRLEDMVSVDLAAGGKKKLEVASRYLDVIRHLRNLNNFESIFAIFSVLKVSGLRSKMSKSEGALFDELNDLTSANKNYAIYRKKVSESHMRGPVLHHLQVFLNDLDDSEDGITGSTVEENWPQITNHGRLLIQFRSSQEIEYPSIKIDPDICSHLNKLRADAKGKTGDKESNSHFMSMASSMLESFGNNGSPQMRNYGNYIKKGIKCDTCHDLFELSKKNVSDLTIVVGRMFELKILQQVLRLEDRESVITVDSNKMKKLAGDIKHLEEVKKTKMLEIRNTAMILNEIDSTLIPILNTLLESVDNLSEGLAADPFDPEAFVPLLDNTLSVIDKIENLKIPSSSSSSQSSLPPSTTLSSLPPSHQPGNRGSVHIPSPLRC